MDFCKNNQVTEEKSHWDRDCTTHKQQFGYLLDSALYSDVTFLVGQKNLPVKAHKLILLMRSPVFQCMFKENPGVQETEIPIEEFTIEEFRMFLRLVYTGNSDVALKDALKILLASYKFKIPDITKICVTVLKNNLLPSNAIDIYQHAKICLHNDLANLALKLICSKAYSILESDDIFKLTADNLSCILNQDDMVVFSEMQIFVAVLRWARNECRKQDLKYTEDNTRLVLAKVIKNIRFPLMNTEDILLIVKPTGVLTPNELLRILEDFIVSAENRLIALPDQQLFNSKARIYYKPSGRNYTLRRLPTRSSNIISKESSEMWNCISFKVDKPIWITAIGINPVAATNKLQLTNTVEHEAKIMLQDLEQKTIFASRSFVGEVPFMAVSILEFDQPILLTTYKWYTASVKIKGPEISLYSGGKKTHVLKCDKIIVKFDLKNAKSGDEVTNINQGHIPSLVFKVS